MSRRRDGTNKQTTREDRATQLLTCETLSLAIDQAMNQSRTEKGEKKILKKKTTLQINYRGKHANAKIGS